MLNFINNLFRKARKTLGKVPFLKPKPTDGVFPMTEEVEQEQEQTQEQKERRARIKKRTHRYTFNRSDRRFLKRLIGEDYPAGSKTTRVLWQRVQQLKNLKVSIEVKRAVASNFILNGVF